MSDKLLSAIGGAAVGAILGWFGKLFLERRHRAELFESGRSTTYSTLTNAIDLYQHGREVSRAESDYTKMWHVVANHPPTEATRLVKALTSDVAIAAQKIEAREVTMDQLQDAINEDLRRGRKTFPRSLLP